MQVSFPQPSAIDINMMPIIMGDDNSIPVEYHGYLDMINQCDFPHSDTVYLTITEKEVEKNGLIRRPGIHTDATNNASWGSWGGKKGIYITSNDGGCRYWPYFAHKSEIDHMGQLLDQPHGDPVECLPNTLYHIGDHTPHESLPAKTNHMRQFFRLVGPDVGLWWKQHSTVNPLGVLPKAPIIETSKFVTA